MSTLRASIFVFVEFCVFFAHFADKLFSSQCYFDIFNSTFFPCFHRFVLRFDRNEIFFSFVATLYSTISRKVLFYSFSNFCFYFGFCFYVFLVACQISCHGVGEDAMMMKNMKKYFVVVWGDFSRNVPMHRPKIEIQNNSSSKHFSASNLIWPV